MPPTVRSVTSADGGTLASASLTLSPPGGIVNGDFLLGMACFRDAGDLAISGFTTLRNSLQFPNVFQLFAAIKPALGESGNYPVSRSSPTANRRVGLMVAIAGAAAYSSLVTGSATQNTTVTLPNITTSENDSTILYLVWLRSGSSSLEATVSAISGDLSLVLFEPSSANPGCGVAIFSLAAPTAGTYSGRQISCGASGPTLYSQVSAIAFSPAQSSVSVDAQLSAVAGLSALVQPSVVATAQLGAIADLAATLTVGSIPGVAVDAQLSAIAGLSALVQTSVVVDAQLGAVASLGAQLTVGGIPGVSVDAQLGAVASLTALVQPSVVVNAQLGAIADLTAQLTVGGEVPLVAIANLGAIASLTALISPAPLPSAQWISLGKVYPLTNQWLRFPVASTGGQTFRIQFGNLGVSTVYWRSYGVLRPIYRDAQNTEFSGNGVKIYPSTERRALDLPIPPDLLAAGFTMRWFEVKKFFYRARYGSFSEPNWFVILEDLV